MALEWKTRRMEEVVAMLRDRMVADTMIYKGLTFHRALHRAPGGGPLSRDAARAVVRRMVEQHRREGTRTTPSRRRRW